MAETVPLLEVRDLQEANAYRSEAQCTLLVVQLGQTTPLNNQENMPTNKGYRLTGSLEMSLITNCHHRFVYVIRQNVEAISRQLPHIQGCKGVKINQSINQSIKSINSLLSCVVRDNKIDLGI